MRRFCISSEKHIFCAHNEFPLGFRGFYLYDGPDNVVMNDELLPGSLYYGFGLMQIVSIRACVYISYIIYMYVLASLTNVQFVISINNTGNIRPEVVDQNIFLPRIWPSRPARNNITIFSSISV